MPSPRRSQRSTAAGVAAGGFIVAAVIGAFLVVGGIVAHGVWPDDPSDVGLPPLVLEPLVLPPPVAPEPPAPPAGPSPTPAGTLPAVAAARTPTVPGSVVTPPRPAPGPDRDGPPTGGASGPPSSQTGADAEAPPATGTLAPVVDRAQGLTAGTARELRSASVALEALTSPISADGARVVGDAVDCLADVAEGAGARLAQGVGGPAPEANPAPPWPGARPAPEDPTCRLAPHVPGAGDGAPSDPAPGHG